MEEVVGLHEAGMIEGRSPETSTPPDLLSFPASVLPTLPSPGIAGVPPIDPDKPARTPALPGKALSAVLRDIRRLAETCRRSAEAFRRRPQPFGASRGLSSVRQHLSASRRRLSADPETLRRPAPPLGHSPNRLREWPQLSASGRDLRQAAETFRRPAPPFGTPPKVSPRRRNLEPAREQLWRDGYTSRQNADVAVRLDEVVRRYVDSP